MSDSVRVLVVEDDPSLREILKGVLENRGLTVVAASGGEEALERAREEAFDLIVADIRMDGISGLDTIERARQIQPNVGSIVVSGYASEEETLRAVRLNVAGYLKKPFKANKLLELINKFLAKRSDRLKREAEVTSLKEVVFWSIEEQIRWAGEEPQPKLQRPAELAQGLARKQKMDKNLRREIYLGTLLKSLHDAGGQKPPESLTTALSSLPLLLNAAEGQGLARLALAACGASDGAEWPTPEKLGSDLEPELVELYRAWLQVQSDGAEADGDEEIDEAVDTNQLNQAAALERLGDDDGARDLYQQLVRQGRISPKAIQAYLRLARLESRRGNTQELEKHIKELLQVASRLGPVTSALTKFDGALILHQAKHPATFKLLRRAADGLKMLGFPVIWASAVVLAESLQAGDSDELTQALETLASPTNLFEVLEQMEALFPALLELSAQRENPQAISFCKQFVSSYPLELVGPWRSGELSLESRQFVMDLLESRTETLPKLLTDLLVEDPEPELQERARKLAGKGDAEETLPMLKLHTFGGVTVNVGNSSLGDKDWKTQKAKYLFVRIASAAPRPVSVDRLMDEFWPEAGERARNNLNTSVSFIRKCLRDAGLETVDPIERMGDSLGIHPKLPVWHDVKEFLKASDAAQRSKDEGRLENALSAFGRMARLYQGAYLDGCYYDWAIEERERLENLVAQSLENLMTNRLEQHRHHESLEFSLNLLRMQPYNEAAHTVVLRSYVGLEQHERAVKHYEDLEKTLIREFGTEPSVELMKVYQMARYGFQESSGLMDI